MNSRSSNCKANTLTTMLLRQLTGGNRHRKKKLKKVVKNEQTIGRGVWKMMKNNTKTRFQEKVKELVDVDAPNLCNTFKESMLQACDEIYGKKKGRKNYGDAWLCNEEMKEAIQQKKVAYKMIRIYQSCIRSAMLYGSKTWFLRENEMAILRRTVKAMMRAMCGVKIIEKRSQELKSLLGLKDTLDEIARAMVWAYYEKR